MLAIDVGNTSTSVGLFEGLRLKREWRMETESLKDFFEPANEFAVTKKSNIVRNRELILRFRTELDCIVSSVVPKVDKFIKKAFPKAIFISHKNIGIRIKVKNPSEVGADRLVNALAVSKLYGTPAIVVDFGTATTFDVISKNGEYLGGTIVPGIQMSVDALHERTAKLPKITIKAPKKVIGDSTISAMQSGILYGYVSLVEGMISRIKSEILNSKSETNSKSKILIVATGGYAKFIAKYALGIDIIDTDLTLKGLMGIAYELDI
ncbi:type III pantothenate kinase [Candidatus Saganbacteria bacterium]|nr:type III pantothenate kinase [Candidatus Saganbacteria bacterium]